MDEDNEKVEKPKRPNAAYKLTPQRHDENKLNFYYSREKRLEKAPQAVREMYEPTKKPGLGLLRPLLANRSRAMLFISIVLIFCAMMAITVFEPSSGTEFMGNAISVQAAYHDGTIIAVLGKTTARKRFAKAASVYTGAVEISAFPVFSGQNAGNSKPPETFFHRIVFTAAASEEYRFSLPFAADSFILVLQARNSHISITVPVE